MTSQSEDAVAVRDRVVLSAFGLGAVLALVGWLVVGLWVALVVLLVMLAIGAVAYRIEAPRIDIDHPGKWDPDAPRPSERVEW